MIAVDDTRMNVRLGQMQRTLRSYRPGVKLAKEETIGGRNVCEVEQK